MPIIFISKWSGDRECCSNALRSGGVPPDVADATVAAAPPAFVIDGDDQAQTVTDGLNACGCDATRGGSTHGLALMHSIHPSLLHAVHPAPRRAKAKKPG